MGNCGVSGSNWIDSSCSDSKTDEQQPFTFCTNDVNDQDSMEGWLLKKSKYIGSWRKRWTLLSKDMNENIFVLQTFKDKDMKSKPTSTISIHRNIKIETNSVNGNQFTIYDTSSKTSVLFKSSSNKRCDRWINMITHKINDITPNEDEDHKYNETEKFELNIDCDSPRSMYICAKHLPSNQMYTVHIEDQAETISDLSQRIETAKQQKLLQIKLKECNKVSRLLNLGEDVVELVLNNDNEPHIIELKPQKEEIVSNGKTPQDDEEKAYIDAILSTTNTGNGPFCSIEGLADRSVFKQHKKDKDPSTKNMKKIMKEIRKDLPDNIFLSYNNGSMFVRFDESNPRFIEAMLIGLGDTPYFNGCFLFHIYLCIGYPGCAPHVQHTTNNAHLVTANNGPGGFSPNLHKDTGKVCLSLLGTWSGPGWTTDESNVYQILSTLLFMVFGAKHPYYMEPDFGGWEGTVNDNTNHDPEVIEYDEEVLYHTAKSTILDILKKPYIGFEDVIKMHFKMKSKQMVQYMDNVLCNKAYSESFKTKIKPIYNEIKAELNKL